MTKPTAEQLAKNVPPSMREYFLAIHERHTAVLQTQQQSITQMEQLLVALDARITKLEVGLEAVVTQLKNEPRYHLTRRRIVDLVKKGEIK